MPPFPARRDRLTGFVHDNDLDGFFVSHATNVSYLTNFSGDSTYLMAGRDRTLLVSDGRYTQQLTEECPGLEAHIRPPSQRLPLATQEVLGKLGWKKIGFESGHMTVADFERYKEALPGVEWRPCEEVVENFRICKDETEVAEIRASIGIAERAFNRLRLGFSPSDSEKRLSDRLEMFLREEGAKCSAFSIIVAAGPRSALPHAPLTDRPVGEEELVLIDWGASGRFYKSDLTRVLATRSISPKLEQVHGVVLRAQRRAIQRIRPGVKAQDVDAEARSALEEAGFGRFFSHGLGHGFGLDIHEAPFLRPGSDIELKAGMVVTVEPGVYLPEWGGVRIEDDVLITPDGCEVLTSVSTDL